VAARTGAAEAVTRKQRIALEIFAPTLLGVLLPFAFWQGLAALRGASGQFLLFQAQDLARSLIWVYLFGGPPSVGYMAIMEWRFARGLDPRSWRAVGLSTLLGLAAGLGIALFLVFSWWPHATVPLNLGGIGLTVGFVLGLVIRRFSRPAPVSL